MTMDPNDLLLLPFTVSWATIEPHFVLGKWTCFYRSGDSRQKIACPDAQKNIKLAYEKGFNSGNFTIAPSSFKASDTVTIHLKISELKTNMQYLCGINLKVQPEGTENVPVVLHSDVPFNTHIDMNDDHQFSCDIDYGNTGALGEDVIDAVAKYEVRMYDLHDETDEPDAIYNEHRNAIKVPADFFTKNKVYVFRCEVDFEKNGKLYNGKAWKMFNTQ